MYICVCGTRLTITTVKYSDCGNYNYFTVYTSRALTSHTVQHFVASWLINNRTKYHPTICSAAAAGTTVALMVIVMLGPTAHSQDFNLHQNGPSVNLNMRFSQVLIKSI